MNAVMLVSLDDGENYRDLAWRPELPLCHFVCRACGQQPIALLLQEELGRARLAGSCLKCRQGYVTLWYAPAKPPRPGPRAAQAADRKRPGEAVATESVYPDVPDHPEYRDHLFAVVFRDRWGNIAAMDPDDVLRSVEVIGLDSAKVPKVIRDEFLRSLPCEYRQTRRGKGVTSEYREYLERGEKADFSHASYQEEKAKWQAAQYAKPPEAALDVEFFDKAWRRQERRYRSERATV